MQISSNDWKRYISKLAAINQKAADAMQFWMETNPDADVSELIYTAYILSDRYGEAAAALACEMYDTTAAAQGVTIPPAEPAPTATYQETAKAIQGTIKNQRNSVPQTVGRLVKQAGADTMLKNAARDGAEFAWIPSGDTCAFCLTLASRGWQRQSKKAAQRHAEHIHPNCDCNYQVRFDGKSTVEGYDPEALQAHYYAAEGDTPKEKINSMRREIYAEDPERFRAQKRAAYAKRTEFKSVLDQYKNSATPGEGKKIIEANRKIKNREGTNFDLLYEEYGGDITMPAESRENGKKNPDYLWRNRLWEEQEPSVASKTSIDQNTREAIHQIVDNPGGIVLDIGNSEMPTSEVKEIVLHRLQRSSPFSCDVVLIRNGSVEDIWRYKKR